MVIYNATDVPIEFRGKVLVTGVGVDFPEVKSRFDLSPIEFRSLDRGILTTFWPAPVDKIANRFPPGPQKIETVYSHY